MKIRALNHPLRRKLLFLIKNNRNRMNVTEIYTRMRIEQSVASQHLATLRREGLVSTKRQSRTIWYSVNEAAIKHVLKCCERMLK